MVNTQQFYGWVMFLTQGHDNIDKRLTSIKGGVRSLTKRLGILDSICTTLRIVQEKVTTVEVESAKQEIMLLKNDYKLSQEFGRVWASLERPSSSWTARPQGIHPSPLPPNPPPYGGPPPSW